MADPGERRGLTRSATSPRRRAGIGPVCVWVWFLACAASSTTAPEARRDIARAPTRPRSSGLSGGFRNIEAVGQNLELDLPDAGGWRRDARETQSWVAVHRATESRLIARAWQHDAVAQIAECERQARLWRRDLPELGSSQLVEARKLVLAGVYSAQIRVGVTESGADGLRGDVLAFGGSGRDCLMLAFTTQAAGAGASRIVAERLSVFSELVFERVRRTSIGARVVVPRL